MEKKNVPKIRFPGFTEPWEQRKLGEIGFAKSGVGFPDKEQGGKEGIPFFKVSDMNTEGNENELIVSNNYVTEEQIKRKKGELPCAFCILRICISANPSTASRCWITATSPRGSSAFSPLRRK